VVLSPQPCVSSIFVKVCLSSRLSLDYYVIFHADSTLPLTDSSLFTWSLVVPSVPCSLFDTSTVGLEVEGRLGLDQDFLFSCLYPIPNMAFPPGPESFPINTSFVASYLDATNLNGWDDTIYDLGSARNPSYIDKNSPKGRVTKMRNRNKCVSSSS
jgi:hypothetical protein